MPIRVRLLRPYSDAAGREEVEVTLTGSDVRDLVQALVKQFPPLAAELLDGSGNLDFAVNFILNDRILTSTELTTTLRDGDVVTLMAPLSGG